ncbi:hypothetical protein BO79DRAFT_144508, partial [Aspergillus costaricaensis CBS 115574]
LSEIAADRKKESSIQAARLHQAGDQAPIKDKLFPTNQRRHYRRGRPTAINRNGR